MVFEGSYLKIQINFGQSRIDGRDPCLGQEQPVAGLAGFVTVYAQLRERLHLLVKGWWVFGFVFMDRGIIFTIT